MKPKNEGEGLDVNAPQEDNKDNEAPLEELAALYQVGNQEVGVATNDEIFAINETPPSELAEEATSAEAKSESTEAFLKAKAKYEELKAQIEVNNYYLHFLHEMDSAQRNIQVAEAIAQNEDYTEERKTKTAVNAANFLNDLNNRLTAELARLNPKTEEEPVLATSDVLDSDILDGATVNFADFESTDESTGTTNESLEPLPVVSPEDDPSFVDLVKEDPLMTPKVEEAEPSYVDLMEEVTVNSEINGNVKSEVPLVESVPVSVSSVEVVPVSDVEVAPAVTANETTPASVSETVPVTAEAEAKPLVDIIEKMPQAVNSEAAEAALSKYQEKRAEWREFNKMFKKTEGEYKKGLEDYYERRGALEIMRTGARSLLGLEPKFPPEVAELQAKYSEAKKFYALEFSKVLALRGEAHEGNADYSLKRKEVKRAMAQKFILKPAEQLLNLQKETALAESERSTTKKVMGFMSKHKWGVRVGTVLLAGGVGLASGGLSVGFAAAGSRVVRMAAGMAGGALAGAGVNRAMKGYAETGEKNVASAEDNARENFDLANLDELESELLSAQADKDTRDARRTAATVLAAGAAGFGSGILAADIPVGGVVPDYSNEGNNYPASENNVNYSNEGLNYPTPIEATEVIPGNEYVVESGDNLWNIMKVQYADALKDLSPAEQNRVLAELFERANADETLRDSIGLRDSNNLNLIYPGEKLELQGLGKELQEIINQDKPEVVPDSSVVGSGIVESSNPFTPMTETVFEDQNYDGISVKPTIDLEGDMDAGISVKPELETEPALSVSENSFAPRPYSADGNYFALPEYKEFALGAMGGVEQITNSVNSAIDSVEGKQDVIEALLGKPRVYDALKGLTVESLNNLGKTPGAIENFAVTNGVEENMLREWMNNFDQIKKSDLPYSGTTRFADLFTRSVIENHVNSLFK